jgi:hypothetical protein
MCILVQMALFPSRKRVMRRASCRPQKQQCHVYAVSDQRSWSACRPRLHFLLPKGRAVFSVEEPSAYFGFLCHGKVVSINLGPTPKRKHWRPAHTGSASPDVFSLALTLCVKVLLPRRVPRHASVELTTGPNIVGSILEVKLYRQR